LPAAELKAGNRKENGNFTLDKSTSRRCFSLRQIKFINKWRTANRSCSGEKVKHRAFAKAPGFRVTTTGSKGRTRTGATSKCQLLFLPLFSCIWGFFALTKTVEGARNQKKEAPPLKMFHLSREAAREPQ